MKIRFNSGVWCCRTLAALTVVLLSATSAAAEFFATPLPDGGLAITDIAGAEVDVVNGEPVGTRPEICPVGAYYFNELATDKAQMVLTDCATGEGDFSVEFQAE